VIRLALRVGVIWLALRVGVIAEFVSRPRDREFVMRWQKGTDLRSVRAFLDSWAPLHPARVGGGAAGRVMRLGRDRAVLDPHVDRYSEGGFKAREWAWSVVKAEVARFAA
jgi:hypothetical protein